MSAFPFGHAALTYRQLFELLRTRYHCKTILLCRPGEVQDSDGTPACGLLACEREIEGRTVQRVIPFYSEDEPVMPTTMGNIFRTLKLEGEPPY